MKTNENKMGFDEYQELAARTAAKYDSRELQLSILGLGVGGEAGEVQEMIKKHVGHGHPLDKEKLTKEIGDCCWYLACLCETCDIKLSDVAEKNIAKLKARYPEGFSTERSMNRAKGDT